MQKLLFLFLFVPAFFPASGTILTWDGCTQDDSWITSANLDGDVIPGIEDDVVISNAGTKTRSEVTVHTAEICQYADLKAFGGNIAGDSRDCSIYLLPTDFVTTWKTNNPGTSDSTSITIPTTGGGYNYDVDWENDGTWDDLGVTGSITHDYGVVGTYTVRIRGSFPRIYFNKGGDLDKILSIDQWGNIAWSSMAGAFYGCSNLIYNATDAPDLSNVTSMWRAFREATHFDGDLSNWDVSNVTDMRSVFQTATSFNGNVSTWVVSSVTNMGAMFAGASSFDGDLSNWDVSNVVFMNSMFTSALIFKGDISNWNVSSAGTMNSMFLNAAEFNSNISNWVVANVVDMSHMFENATSFNHSLSNWNVTNVNNLSNMLDNCGMGVVNYDSTLTGWSAQMVPSNLTLGAAGLSYCGAVAERDILINTFGWTINGDTYYCPPIPGLWDGDAGDGEWTTPANWDGDMLPTMNDDVVINNGDSVVLSTGSVMVKSITLDNDSDLTTAYGSTLTVTGFTGTGIDAGSCPNCIINNSGTINVNGGSYGIVTGSELVNNLFANINCTANSVTGITANGPVSNAWQIIITGPCSDGAFRHNNDFTNNSSGLLRIINASSTAVVSGPGTTFSNLSGGFVDINGNAAGGMSAENLVNNSLLYVRGTTSFALSVSGTFDNTGGTLKGIGHYNMNGNDMNGTVEPGFQIGTMTFSGDQSFTASNTLKIEVNGTTPNTQYDQVVVGDTATVDGTLNATINYTPTHGDRIVVLTAASVSGTFATIDPALPANWSVDYSVPGEIALVYAEPVGFWDGDAGDGEWTTAANWTANTLPGASDDVVIDNGDVVTISSGTITVKSISLDLSSALHIDNGVALNIQPGSTTALNAACSDCHIINNGTIQIDGGNTGLSTHANFTNQAGGLLQISNVTGNSINLQGALQLDNYGTVNINPSGFAGIYHNVNGSNITNYASGVIQINGTGGRQWGMFGGVVASIDNQGIISINGGVGSFTPPNFSINSGATFSNTGTLSGNGRFYLAGISLDGIASPGNSPGTMQFIGNQTFTASNTTAIEVNGTTPGTEHDQIIVTGDATISGILTATINYTPTAEDRIVFLTASTISGTFSSVSPALPFHWSIDYSVPGEVALVYRPYFITTWKTDNPGTSNSTSVTIPTTGAGYHYDVDWDSDGVWDDLGVTGSITHDYGVAGTYTVRIRGAFPRIYFNNGGDREKILSIDQWGNMAWSSMAGAFAGCSNLTSTATDAPNLSNVTELATMFLGAANFNGDVSNWDVSGVTNMLSMFRGAVSFNGDVSNWDVSNVTNMGELFRDATNFQGDVSNWDVSGVNSMGAMFLGASAFNGDVSTWVVTNVTNMSSMFAGAHNFNGDLSNWDVSNVSEMRLMFFDAPVFNADLSNWNVGSVTDMLRMFQGASHFNRNLGNWDITNVTDMASMLNNSGLDVTNYDSTLIGWAAQTVQPDIILGANGLYYCDAAAARDTLTLVYNWTINDGGIWSGCGQDTTTFDMGAWNYGPPTFGKVAIILGDYVTSVDGGSLDAKAIIVETGGSLILENGFHVHIIEGMTTNGVLDVQVGGDLETQYSP